MKYRIPRTQKSLKTKLDEKKARLESLVANFRNECIVIRNNREIVGDVFLFELRALKAELIHQRTFIDKLDQKYDNGQNDAITLFGADSNAKYLNEVRLFSEYKDFVYRQFAIISSNLKYIRYYIPSDKEYKEFLDYFNA